MNKTESAVLVARLSVDGICKKHSWMTSGKTSYSKANPHVVNILLKKYATGKHITETTPDISHVAQPSRMKPFQYAEEVVAKTLQCEDVYEECTLNEIFIEGLDTSIRHCMRYYLEKNKHTNFHGLAFHTTSLRWL